MKPEYIPNFITNPDEIFNKLLTLPWLDLTENRMEYFMAHGRYSYNYGKAPYNREYFSSEYSPEVLLLERELNRYLGVAFNVCFLNRYNSQRHQLGWHSDDSPTMDGNHPIAVVSFGAEREIWWKTKAEKGIVPPEQRQKLANGSLFVMPGGFQDDHFHRIPKADREVGTRISLTFRKYII